jgi:hypothetical protein
MRPTAIEAVVTTILVTLVNSSHTPSGAVASSIFEIAHAKRLTTIALKVIVLANSPKSIPSAPIVGSIVS